MTKKPRRAKPKRSLRSMMESLAHVVKIEHVEQEDCLLEHGRAQHSAFSREISMAVWNMQKGAGGFPFEHDFRALSYRSDLILTQEALLSSRSLRTFKEPGFEFVHAASYKRRDGLRDGVMTASRVASHDSGLRIVCRYPEPIFKTPKVALVSRFPIAGIDAQLLVINIHATLVRSVKGAREEMEHLVERLPEHDGPIVLAGDFNTFTPGYLRAVSEVLATIGLKFVEIAEDPRPRSQALDQVFVRGVDVKSISIDTSIRNSDHFPVVCNFVIL